MADVRPWRTVVVSAVRHAARYADLLAAHPDYLLVAVAEGDAADNAARAAARSLAETHGLPVWRLDDIRPDRADLAVVCSEPTRHAELATKMLELGLHVLVDKPLATNPSAATRIVETAHAMDRTCAAVTRALAPAIHRARGWVDAGHLGLPRSVDVEFLASGAHFASSVERPELVVDPTLSGGGEVMNFLGYPIDYVRAITGCEPVEIFAESGALFSAPHQAFGVEDVALVSARFTHGVMASFVIGRVPQTPGDGPGTSTIRLVGSHGHLELDVDAPVVHLQSRGHTESLLIERSPMDAVLDELSTSLRLRRRPRYDCLDAAVAVASIDAAYRSIASGAPAQVHAEHITATGNRGQFPPNRTGATH